MTAAAAVSNLVHFDTTPRMVRAAHALHARSCAQFAARRTPSCAKPPHGSLAGAADV
jgi:hypothetical protein